MQLKKTSIAPLILAASMSLLPISKMENLSSTWTTQEPPELSEEKAHSTTAAAAAAAATAGESHSTPSSFSGDGTNLESGSPGVCVNDSKSVEESETKSENDKNGGSAMWNKLENWRVQYERDSEFWGVGTGPIFTVFQNSDGKVERVIVNEDEIMRRARIDPMSCDDNDELAEVNHKISFAKDLANEMENGSDVIPRNSSVAKFLHTGGKSRFMEVIRGVTLKPGSFPKQSRVGFFALCGLCLIWAVRGIFLTGEKSKKLTRLEKEMLQRKVKARAENEKMAKGNVEIVTPLIEPQIVSLEKPQLNKEELVNSIIKAKESYSEVGVVQYSGYQNKEQKDKIEEIRAMARHAREIEREDSLSDDLGKENYRALEDLSRHSLNPQNEFQSREVYKRDSDRTTELNPFADGGITEECETEVYDFPNVTESLKLEASNMKQEPRSSSTNEANHLSEGPSGPLVSSSRKKLRIIKSAKEAREYLSLKHHKLEVDQTEDEVGAYIASDRTSKNANLTNKVNASPHLNTAQDFSHPSEDYVTVGEKAEENTECLDDMRKSRMFTGGEVSVSSDSTEADSDSEDTKNSEIPDKNEVADAAEDKAADLAPLINKENWLDKNFNKFEPIVEKIGVGFKDNYWAAREKASLEPDLTTELAELKETAYSELEWMKDERLAEIVFKVRDNELSGRDPFHLISEEDKHAFFSGLEKKVQQENEKLLKLHEYFHSNIENLDYGADGISVYDPPEKIIPRWKVPPAETNPEFLNNFVEQRKTLFSESHKNSISSKRTGKKMVHKSEKPSSHKNSQLDKPSTDPQKANLASSRTIIQGSDGSIKAGKRSGKEFWEHTKKWSRGTLESYNAETDPEIKAVMRDMGKDLDRWTTEKEIQETADLMDKIPEKRQKFIKEKLAKVKREVELFGPQAVVSKYREYGEDKEEDYLWWLDLPSVLCIEMYTVENGEQRVGLYSLEMAADLELDPKQYHVIAFEHAGDCKNFCYIIQAHLEMLGNGNAFVVARPPKDAFREAKANGFSVTVIRKGELQLNIDQTLEEVEELITEIGSKMYHDKITKERSVDIDVMMKGVFGSTKPAKRGRRKRKSRRRIKP
ncbi:embryo defective 1703 [Striga hermonthica]|uniref:Embryo defective 1703 n=1 Tax=Striga hermonthica TaxID=68872 RepID=A0A9N7R8L0_STRHE|nr:embryo defective 1703 [Striga hermonthica]